MTTTAKATGVPGAAAHLTDEQVEALGAELDAIRAEVVGSLGEADARYIHRTIAAQRTLAAAGRVSLQIFDTTGRLVRTLVDETRPAGAYEASWDGRDSAARQVPSGVSFARMRVGGVVHTTKLVFIK